MEKIALVMPSYQNRAMCREALTTLVNNTAEKLVIHPFEDNVNHGWIKGCNIGIEATKGTEYVVLANDDILVPGLNDWAGTMLNVMDINKNIGALSVLTMNAMGYATLNAENCVMKTPYEVPFCSFFFVMLRREAIEKAGLLDESLPGGDDLDYCMRLREAGYKIAITPQVFIWHHYAQTGKRIFGNYWDSEEHTEKINHALIRKHGFKKFIYSKYLGLEQGGK